jgi:hypothetical protein
MPSRPDPSVRICRISGSRVGIPVAEWRCSDLWLSSVAICSIEVMASSNRAAGDPFVVNAARRSIRSARACQSGAWLRDEVRTSMAYPLSGKGKPYPPAAEMRDAQPGVSQRDDFPKASTALSLFGKALSMINAVGVTSIEYRCGKCPLRRHYLGTRMLRHGMQGWRFKSVQRRFDRQSDRFCAVLRP